MPKIAWITDSTATLDPGFIQKHSIIVLPIVINFDGEIYRDGIDITEEAFYEKLRVSKNLPKSSQPSIGELVELYEGLKKEYDRGIALHISTELSGTANASLEAAKIAGFPLELVDTRYISLPIGAMLEEGIKRIENGNSVEETATYLRTMHTKAQLYVSVGSLEQLHKGGRVSGAQLLLGSLLQVKPILTMKDGKIVPHDKVRSKKKALGQLIAYLEEALASGKNIATVFLLGGQAEEDVSYLEEKIRTTYPSIRIQTGTLGAAIGVHAGAGTIAIAWVEN